MTMNSDAIIEVRNVSKVYPSQIGRISFFKRLGQVLKKPGENPRKHIALDDISFQVFRGESVGIIGANGSGKSTLLRLIAGVTVPTSGEVIVRGKIVPLLELGAGFHPLLTGRENIYLNARILGMSREETQAVFDQIVEFSGLEDVIDQPLSTYSSGMYVRLGFSVAVHANPDVFLVDEVLAVGDMDFQKKCIQRIAQLKEEKKTILFVSHDLGMVHSLCDRVILLAHGKMVQRRTPKETIEYYLRQIGSEKGICTCQWGGLEWVFNHGKSAVFYNQTEVTAPEGISLTIQSFGYEHSHFETDWTVISHDSSTSRIEGRMFRLPIIQSWETTLLNENKLNIRIGLKITGEITLQAVRLLIPLRTFYRYWLYGNHEGEFPPITPQDSGWTCVVSPEECWSETAVIPVRDLRVPGIIFRFHTPFPYWHVSWCNSDYATGARLLLFQIRFPEEGEVFPQGSNTLMSVTVEFEQNPLELKEKYSRSVRSDVLVLESTRIHFSKGSVRIFYKDTEITKAAGLYFTMLIQGLWHDSIQFSWENPVISENVLQATGVSRRFPLRQVWSLKLASKGFHCVIKLDVQETIVIQEYNFSVCLNEGYRNWATEKEEAQFPAFHTDSNQWRHINRDYTARKFIRAEGPQLPSITLRCSSDLNEHWHFTAINTDYRLQTRVIQSFCSFIPPGIVLSKGEYVLFDGQIQIEPPPDLNAEENSL